MNLTNLIIKNTERECLFFHMVHTNTTTHVAMVAIPPKAAVIAFAFDTFFFGLAKEADAIFYLPVC